MHDGCWRGWHDSHQWNIVKCLMLMMLLEKVVIDAFTFGQNCASDWTIPWKRCVASKTKFIGTKKFTFDWRTRKNSTLKIDYWDARCGQAAEQSDPECPDPAAMLSRFLGPRYRELAKNWVPTASMWGAVGLVWATDWRLILDWVPYINGKFKKDD